MSVSDVFQHFVQVSATLLAHFPTTPEIAQETLTEYSSSHDLPDVPWLQQSLPQLAEVLSRPPSFNLKLRIEAAGYKAASIINRDAGGNLTLSGHAVDDSELAPPPSPQAQQTLTNFRGLFANQPVDLNAVAQQATALINNGVPLALTLDVYLNKASLIRSLRNAVNLEVTAEIVAYLFQRQLIGKLGSTTVDRFETEFLRAGKPTVFLVFDLVGGLASDFITVCGRHQHDAVEAAICRPLADDNLTRAAQTHDFRQSQSLGNFAPRWLMPDLFALAVTRGDPNDSAELKRELQRFQATLAAIFMADFVEANANGIYSVEYRAFKPKRFELLRDQLLLQEEHWPRLYELYRYAYDGISGDKLEIVQQFISQFAEDIPTLFAKANEIRVATKKTHDRTLVTKVQEYFTARQSIQERIQTAVAALTNDTITMSREMSADLYKVMGVIALAIAGWLFSTSIGWVSLLLGFGAIGIYLLIVVFYHLPTLKHAAELRQWQNYAYINSFDDVLEPGELLIFRTDVAWKEARQAFKKKFWSTWAIYSGFCLSSFAVAVGVVVSIWRANPMIPPVKLPALATYLSHFLRLVQLP